MRENIRRSILALSMMLSLLLAGPPPAAHAALERVGPTLPANGYPAWYQDTTGLTLEFCQPLNQAELDGGWCLLLPADTSVPEVFPTTFAEEHFYWAADAVIDDAATGIRARLVLGLEAAFAQGPVAAGDQITFGRIRVRVDPLPSSGTYTIRHPYGTWVIPNQVAGGRLFVTEDIGFNCPTGQFDCALASNLGPLLLASTTPGGPELPPVPGPVPGKLYIADAARLGPVTGSPVNQNYFRVEGPNGFVLETSDFALMGRLYTAPIPGRVTVDRASYARAGAAQKVDVYATAFETLVPRLPGSPQVPPIQPELAFFEAPCAVDPATGALVAPPGTAVTMRSTGSKFWAQSPPATLPAAVCVRDSQARDASGQVVPAYLQAPVTDQIFITEALYDPANGGALRVKATSSDLGDPALAIPVPTLTLAGHGDLANGQILVAPLAAPPATVQVLSSEGGLNLFQVSTGALGSPPTAVNDSATTAQDTAVEIPVVANDSDADGNPLTVIAVTQGANGGVTILGTATSVRYTPNAGFAGTDSFTYTVSDGQGGSATASVSVTVTAANRPPVAVNDTATTTAGTAVTIPVLANDSDPDGDPLTLSSVTQPASGTAAIAGTGVQHTPAAGFTGTATFTYTVSDGRGGTATGSVSVTVNAVVPPPNTPPVAANDTATTAEDSPVDIAVLANDTDANGDPLVVAAVTQPASGSAAVTAGGGSVRYTPAPNFTGTVSFSYTVSDGRGGTATATVAVTVTPVNDAPAGVADSYTVAQGGTLTVAAPGVLANDADPDGNPLTAAVATPPVSGTLTLNADGSFTYVQNAAVAAPTTDTFTYTVSDGLLASAPVTVTISITAAAPPAGLVAAYNFNEATGTSVLDRSGTGNNGTFAATGGPTRVAGGRFGAALSFDGVNDQVTLPDAASLDLTRMTLSAWVNPATLSGWRTVILKEFQTSGMAYALYAHDSAPRPAGYINTGGADIPVLGTAALPLNTWSHLAVTYDGTNMRLYVNGVLVGTRAQTGNIRATGSPLRIGGNAVWGEYFSGLIDEVRVYNRALTAAEIQADMTTPIP